MKPLLRLRRTECDFSTCHAIVFTSEKAEEEKRIKHHPCTAAQHMVCVMMRHNNTNKNNKHKKKNHPRRCGDVHEYIEQEKFKTEICGAFQLFAHTQTHSVCTLLIHYPNARTNKNKNLGMESLRRTQCCLQRAYARVWIYCTTMHNTYARTHLFPIERFHCLMIRKK